MDQVCFAGVQLILGVFYEILEGKVFRILLITSCTPTKLTWSEGCIERVEREREREGERERERERERDDIGLK